MDLHNIFTGSKQFGRVANTYLLYIKICKVLFSSSLSEALGISSFERFACNLILI